MQLEQSVRSVLANALEGRPPSKPECAALLRLAPDSFEAAVLKATADVVSRRRFGNKGILLAQIGLETAPCPGIANSAPLGKITRPLSLRNFPSTKSSRGPVPSRRVRTSMPSSS